MMGEPMKLQPRVVEIGWSHNSETWGLEERIAKNVVTIQERKL